MTVGQLYEELGLAIKNGLGHVHVSIVAGGDVGSCAKIKFVAAADTVGIPGNVIDTLWIQD